MTAEKVTVYITNYNYGRFLEKAITSVLAQTYPNIEILIFDDGSTDDSSSILEKYADDPEIKIFKKKNEGLNATIIKAFETATGNYVVRLDADDWFEPRIIEKLVTEIKKDDEIALVFPDYYEVDENGNILHRIKRHDFNDNVTILDQPAHGACTLVRKKHYYDVGGHSRAYSCQDGVDLWLALTHKYKVANLNEPLFFYRKHSESLSSNQFRLLQTRFNIYADHARHRGFQSEETLAIIPIRKKRFVNGDYALINVAGRSLLNWTISKAERSKEIDRIAVVTESDDIIEYIESGQPGYSKPTKAYRRDSKLAAVGTDVAETILTFLEKPENSKVKTVVVLTIDTPFSLVNYIDTAIYSMFLFGTDSVDSVITDNALLYYHDGQGLKLWQDIRVRKEREYAYLRKGGISVIKVEELKKQKTMVTQRMGHVIIDKISSYTIETSDDVTIASFIGNQILGIENE